ncbi:hypothetical protein L1887_57267 [Cichorium endivia]|nr:hypothetical protein L1887_57267 [Cichorium endivia]
MMDGRAVKDASRPLVFDLFFPGWQSVLKFRTSRDSLAQSRQGPRADRALDGCLFAAGARLTQHSVPLLGRALHTAQSAEAEVGERPLSGKHRAASPALLLSWQSLSKVQVPGQSSSRIRTPASTCLSTLTPQLHLGFTHTRGVYTALHRQLRLDRRLPTHGPLRLVVHNHSQRHRIIEHPQT